MREVPLQPLPIEAGSPEKGLRTFACKTRPESGLDSLTYPKFECGYVRGPLKVPDTDNFEGFSMQYGGLFEFTMP